MCFYWHTQIIKYSRFSHEEDVAKKVSTILTKKLKSFSNLADCIGQTLTVHKLERCAVITGPALEKAAVSREAEHKVRAETEHVETTDNCAFALRAEVDINLLLGKMYKELL